MLADTVVFPTPPLPITPTLKCPRRGDLTFASSWACRISSGPGPRFTSPKVALNNAKRQPRLGGTRRDGTRSSARIRSVYESLGGCAMRLSGAYPPGGHGWPGCCGGWPGGMGGRPWRGGCRVRLLAHCVLSRAALRLEGPGIAWRTRRRAVAGRRWTKAAPRPLGLPVRRRRRRLGGWQIRYLGGLHRRPGIPLPRIRGRGRGRHIVDGRTRGDLLRGRRAWVRLFGRRLEIGFFGAGPAEISPQFVIAVGHCLSPPDVVPRGFRPLSSINYIAACAADAADTCAPGIVSKHN